ncbi:MAG: GNAT family N-acetyltransferase [Alphaproteobacteria bacterium]|nr:GNAT family N-acetyltransferase [Alphaproteobacteria bacterium]|tara:strand:- start:748 stop:1227 length:480 start_codon:yes stop_codon:yes gene_type:complete
MITEYMKKDVSNILSVINNAALKYKGVIPDNCWHEPYMSEEELLNEFDSGVRMFGYKKNNILVGVMGIQELKDITLIRHAYTFSTYQGMGIGKLLLQYLFRINKSSILYVGTWKEATWAIQFYEKFGFVTHKRKKTIELLKKHWKVSLTQIENSVVLEK